MAEKQEALGEALEVGAERDWRPTWRVRLCLVVPA